MLFLQHQQMLLDFQRINHEEEDSDSDVLSIQNFPNEL